MSTRKKNLLDFEYGWRVITKGSTVEEGEGDANLSTAVGESTPPDDSGEPMTEPSTGNQRQQMLVAFIIVVAGIIAHWIWGILVDGLDTGNLDFGTSSIILSRVGIAVIAGAFSFVGIWRQLEGVDTSLRLFAAFTQGFAVDAFTAPFATAVSN